MLPWRQLWRQARGESLWCVSLALPQKRLGAALSTAQVVRPVDRTG
ncbi:tRNA modification GTPase MnmE domain protein [Synechococcus sp. RS9915]|nr:tRNA modification GTPase MnmE domain protein [Synechococcus sp. RS9915]